jgi:hypothetical protein
MMTRTLPRVGLLLAAAMLAARPASPAQGPAQLVRQDAGSAIFRPLLADPKEPRFFAQYLREQSPRLASSLGSVGFGQTIGVWRTLDWQFAIAAGVFSQFDMGSSTTDLVNTDYVVGLPITYRRGALATRVRLYHQSSHLGDGYMAHTHAQRVTLSFESAELLVSRETLSWRLYGGGEYIFTHSPADLKPGVLHGGLEYRAPAAVVRFGHVAAGRLVAGLDGKASQDRDWRMGWSFVTGLELGDPVAPPESAWRWSLLLTAYTGPSPYGQFYRDHVSSVGLGLGFTL